VAVGEQIMMINATHGSSVTVSYPARRGVPLRRPRVAVLPRPGPDPLGREVEQEALTAGVRAGVPVQVYGEDGVGKSTVVRHLSHVLVDAIPDGVIYLRGGGLPVGDLAQEVFEACYDGESWRPSRTDLTRLMSGIGVLVVVDDLPGGRDAADELLDRLPEVSVVLTAAARILWGRGEVTELGGLSPAAAVMLISRELRRPLSAQEAEWVRQMCVQVGGHPLRLLQCASTLIDPNRRDRRTDRPSGGPGVPPSAGDSAACTEAGPFGVPLEVAEEGMAAMSPAARRALTALAVLDGAAVDQARLASVAGLAESATVVEELARAGMVDRLDGRVRIRAPARTVVEPVVDASGWVAAWLGELTGWVAAAAATPRMVAAEYEALSAALNAGLRVGHDAATVAAVRATAPLLAASLRIDGWVDTLDIGIRAAHRMPKGPDWAYLLHERGVADLCRGDTAAAAPRLAEARRLREAAGDAVGARISTETLEYAIRRSTGRGQRSITTRRRLRVKLLTTALAGLATVVTGTVVTTTAHPVSQAVQGAEPTHGTDGPTDPPTPSPTPGSGQGPLPPILVGGRTPFPKMTLRFPPTTVGTVYASNPIEVANATKKPIRLLRISVTGVDADAFEVDASDCANRELAETCTLWILFRPSDPRWYTADLVVLADTTQHEYRIRLLAPATG